MLFKLNQRCNCGCHSFVFNFDFISSAELLIPSATFQVFPPLKLEIIILFLVFMYSSKSVETDCQTRYVFSLS